MILSTMKNIMASVTTTTGPLQVSSEVKQMCLGGSPVLCYFGKSAHKCGQ